MKNKIIQSVPALVGLLIVGFQYFSQQCILTNTSSSCHGTWVHHMYNYVTSPLYFFALYSLPLAIILIFISYSIFRAWWKVAILLLVIAFLFIAGTPVSPGLFSDGRDDAARQAAEVFTALSLILIIWKYFVARKTKTP